MEIIQEYDNWRRVRDADGRAHELGQERGLPRHDVARALAGAARPLLYFTYGRAWFRDATNYPSLSLFEG